MVVTVIRSNRQRILFYIVLLCLSTVGMLYIITLYPLDAAGLPKLKTFNASIGTETVTTIKNTNFVSHASGTILTKGTTSTKILLTLKTTSGKEKENTLKPKTVKNMSLFKEVIKEEDMEIQLAVIDAFHEAMSRNVILYFMYGGTLIGSWRHHGFIPWDDDVDVAVPSDQRHQVFSVLSDLKPQFLLFNSSHARWKFYSNRSHPIKQRPFRWPYIDISFYLSNETHVWDVNTGPNSKFSYTIQTVFPLQPRPFMNRLLLAPFNTEEVLKVSYNIGMCQIGPYDHEKEKQKTLKGLVTNVPCKELENMFPFVQRVRMKTRHGCNETLVNNGSTVIRWFYRDYGSC